MKDAKMRACPRFNACCAPICPLDAEHPKRTHSSSDPVCMWMLEAVKDGAEKRFEGRGQGEVLREVLGALPDICSRWATIRKAVERAKGTGSRMDNPGPRRAA